MLGTPVSRLTRSTVGGAAKTKPAADAAMITKMARDIGECRFCHSDGSRTSRATASTNAGM